MEGLTVELIWLALVLPFCTSFLVTMALVYLAPRIQIFAAQDKRRVQRNATPLLGGIGIVSGMAAFFGASIIAGMFTSTSVPLGAVGLVLIAALGIADDRYELSSSTKFLGQNLVACVLIAAVWGLETPIHTFLSTSPWVVIPVQWFWVMGLLNSMNLIDGLDGLAAGIGMIALSFLAYLAYQQMGTLPAMRIAAIASVGGFLLWNRHPAKIYMGESGSMTIGALIFVASMSLSSRSSAFLTVVAPILAVGIPAFDTAVAIYRRSRRRTALGAGDRDHLHHRLLRLGISHAGVVRIFYAITVYLCLLTYQLFPEDKFSPFNAVLAVAGMAIIAFLVVLVERKLYTYLRNFGDQMLQVMDAQNYGAITTFMRMVNLTEQGIPFKAYRLNLENCIQTLLISSPGRIHTFYTDLAQHLKERASEREIYFESSTKILILHRLESGGSETFLREDVVRILKAFETEKAIDLYLNVPNTLKEIDTEVEIKEKQEQKKRGLFGRRSTDRGSRSRQG